MRNYRPEHAVAVSPTILSGWSAKPAAGHPDFNSETYGLCGIGESVSGIFRRKKPVQPDLETNKEEEFEDRVAGEKV